MSHSVHIHNIWSQISYMSPIQCSHTYMNITIHITYNPLIQACMVSYTYTHISPKLTHMCHVHMLSQGTPIYHMPSHTCIHQHNSVLMLMHTPSHTRMAHHVYGNTHMHCMPHSFAQSTQCSHTYKIHTAHTATTTHPGPSLKAHEWWEKQMEKRRNLCFAQPGFPMPSFQLSLAFSLSLLEFPERVGS